MIRALLLLAVLLGLAAAEPIDAAYTAWNQGRPAEAIPALRQAATSSDHWAAWCNLGLAAAAAGQRGPAVVWLLEAHRRAPAAHQPIQALAVLETEVPVSWSAELGPIAALGQSWFALLAALIAGGGLAAGLLGTRARIPAVSIGLIAALSILPGLIAAWHDASRHFVATAQATALLDSAGRPLTELAPGTVLTLLAPEPHGGRYRVRTPGGQLGSVPVIACQPE
jgi:hypothetical protein